MKEFFQNLISQFKEVFDKLDRTKKMIIAGVIGVFVISLIGLISISSEKGNVLLLPEISVDEFGKITKKLDEVGINYSSSGTRIYVKPVDEEKVRVLLAQEDLLPKGMAGWSLFNLDKWTETEFEKNIKFKRALQGALINHIKSLQNISNAKVEIALPESKLYSQERIPYTAAVTLFFAPGYDKLTKKEIKGIQRLVARAVGNMKVGDVTITDDKGVVISDFDDDFEKHKIELKKVEGRLKFKEKMRRQMLADIKRGLGRIFTSDRVEVIRLDISLNWDEIQSTKKEYSPIVMMPDNPLTPYSELKVRESITRSKKNVEEKFQGHGWNPAGPPGTEGNVPPGYKYRDDQFAKYNKKENIVNEEINEEKISKKRQPWIVNRINSSVVIDGLWKEKEIPKDRKYFPIENDDLKKARDIVAKAIGFDKKRGDIIAVQNIQFDRTAEFNEIDEEIKSKERLRKILLATLVGLFAMVLLFTVSRAVKREMDRRRRLKEEEEALRQQSMREAALKAAEEEGVEVELSLEEKARLEMAENAVQLAREKPEMVANLLRTWLAEE